MDFSDTPEEAAFRAEASAWLEANAELLAPGESANPFAERAEGVEEAQAWQAKKADGGWACISWPTEYGGRGGTAIQNVIWGQEESRFRVAPNIFGIGLGMGGPTIMTHGTPEQKQRWLPKMLRGEEIWCQLFSEPSAGSDLAGLRTRAERDGDEWVINGQKIWTSGAHYSQWGLLVARSDPNVVKHAGLTYFIVDMHSPGIEIRPIKQINGASGFNEVFFTNVRIPDENRISEVGNGWGVSITTLMNERASIGGGGGGAGLDDLIALARSTTIGGRRALDDTSVRHRLADFYVRTKGLQYTGYRALTALSRGQTPGPENSIGKLVGAKMRQEQASLALDLQGEAGVVMDPEAVSGGGVWQTAYLGAPGGRIAGGSDEIMRNIIAERVLRLPPEPRVDKQIAFREIPSGPKS
ncbi:MAG: acyl-CoA dehydrogenase family protein [Myxococcota bacterium]